MAKFAEAVLGNAEVKFFRVVDSEPKHPADWELEPLETDLLSVTDASGLHVMKALNVLPDGAIRDCHMDIFLPERLSDYAFFVEKESLRFGRCHEFPGEIIPASAIDCFGQYELFYSRRRPEIGIDILKRGLAIAKRKHFIAEDLGYILRDERRFGEAAEMFKMAVEEGPSSYFIYGELAAAYGELGDVENEKKYLELFNRPKSKPAAERAWLRRVTKPYTAGVGPMSRILLWFLSLFQKPRKDEGPRPVSQTHKGKPLSVVLKDCGKPTKDSAGYYKHRSEQPCEDLPKGIPPGPHRTLVFRRHRGVLYVWLNQESDSWVCFNSFWLPDKWLL